MNRVTAKRIDDASLPPLDGEGMTDPSAYGAVGIAHIDAEGTILRCNLRFAEMLGYTPEELAGVHTDAITDADEVELQVMLFREMLAGKRRSFQLNKRYIHKDGSIVWAILTVGCARNANGGVDHFVAIISDITEKHKTSQALADSEARFRATFENAAVGMALIGPDGNWLRVNQKVCDIVGYTPDELMQLTFQDLTHPDDLDIDLELLQDAVEGRRDNYSMEKRYFRKDGSLVWVKLTVGCVRAVNRDVDYFISVIEDITSDKRKDEALLRSEERFRATFENAAIGMAQVAPNGRWLNVNRKVCEFLGYSEEELRHLDFQSVTYPDDLQKGLDLKKELFAGQRSSMQMEKRYIHKDGHIVWANLSVACVRNQKGEVDYMISVIDDITEKRQMRRDLMESETRFRAVQQTMPDGFMVFRSMRNEAGQIEDFVCDYGNPAASRLLSIEPEDMPGHRMLERNPLNIDIGLFDIYCGVADTGQTAQGELNFPFQDGSTNWFRYSVVKVDDGIAVAFSDISDAKKSEAQLRESEARFRAVQQTMPNGFMIFSSIRNEAGAIEDFYCEYGNPAAQKILSIGPDEIPGYRMLERDSNSVAFGLFDMYRDVVDTGRTEQGELKFPFRNGAIRWFRYSIVKVDDGFAVAFSEISDAKAAELRLKESEARLRAFHQTTPDGFTIFRSLRNSSGEITDFRFVYANPAAQKWSGLSEEELKQSTMLAEGPALKAAGVFDKYIDVVETGNPWQGEFFYPGERRPAWYYVTAAKVDDGIAISYKDTTSQKESEEKLREQEERARAILNSLISFVTLLTPDGIVIEVNDSALAIANLSASDVIGKHFWDTYWWSHDADAREELRRSVLKAAQGARVRHDTTVRVAGDERISVANMLAPVIDEDGLVTHVVASGFDISDRKKAEQHREMLVGELSHRVKNSLATVQTIASHTLREASDLESFRDTFVGRLMAISKCHDLLVDTTRSDADISQLVRDQVLPYARGGLERQVTMSGPPLVLGPEAAHTFGLILHELATNAAKYGALSTERGRLDISWKRGSDRDRLSAILTWVETGGPPVAPPTRRGFGSVLIEQSLTHSLGGEAEIEYRPEGLWAQFRFRKRAL